MKVYRPDHNFARECVPKNVVGILQKLVKHDYEAYLVGGSVRDILMGLRPKDFDVATSARPEEVKKIFKNSRLIGRRFRLAHIYFDRGIIEVATFRASINKTGEYDVNSHALSSSGQIMRDNVYGTLEEDALRRDFTINALYYDWQEDSVIDYHQGVSDIKHKLLEVIGKPEIRFQEDPVRMLRAVRFATKLEFKIEQSAVKSIHELSGLLRNIPPARLFEEFLKLFQYGFAKKVFAELESYKLLQFLFPRLGKALAQDTDSSLRNFIKTALSDTDQRIANGARTTPAYLLAVLLWDSVKKYAENCHNDPPIVCMHQAGKKALREQRLYMSMPRRFSEMAKDIWELQPKLEKIKGKSPFKVLSHPKFRAGYDFLLLRQRSGRHDLEQLANWWAEFQTAKVARRRVMTGFDRKRKVS